MFTVRAVQPPFGVICMFKVVYIHVHVCYIHVVPSHCGYEVISLRMCAHVQSFVVWRIVLWVGIRASIDIL